MATLQQWVDDPSVRLIGITAAGGYGKSVLASKLYDTVAGFEETIWVNVSQAYSFALWGRWLLEQLGQTVEDGIDDEQLVIVLCNCLQARRYFLVLDNLESLLEGNTRQWKDPAYVKFLSRWMKSSGRGVIVVTSREKPELPTTYLNSSKWIALEGLEISAGVVLLKALDIRGSDTDLLDFVKLADGHPLLLNLSAGFLKEEEGDAPDIAVLKTGNYNLLQIIGDHRDDPETSVEKILEESLNRLPSERQRLLQNLSVYRGAFGLEAAQAMSDETIAQNDVRRLAKRSLLQERRQDGVWIFQFQPLIQQFLQHRDNDLSDAHQRAIGYYLSQCQPLLPNTSPDGAAAPYLEVFYHGIKLGAYRQAWNFIQQQTDDHDQYSSVPMFLKFRGTGTERLQELNLYRQLIESWQPDDNPEQNLWTDALQAIGHVQQFLDQRREALANYEQALQIYRDVGASPEARLRQRLGEANTLQAIGHVQQFLKQSREALANYEQALQIYRDVGDRLGEANTLKAIGDVQQFLKQSREALANYEQALQIYRDVGTRLGEANTLLELGRLLDDAHQSLEMYESAQEIYIQIGDRYSQARTLFMYISDALLTLGRVEEAIAALTEVIQIGEEIGFDLLCELGTKKLEAVQEAIQAHMASDE
jgi:tetratricopeptide (TPR) repeat protein